jgi:hypothetical protein
MGNMMNIVQPFWIEISLRKMFMWEIWINFVKKKSQPSLRINILRMENKVKGLMSCHYTPYKVPTFSESLMICEQ